VPVTSLVTLVAMDAFNVAIVDERSITPVASVQVDPPFSDFYSFHLLSPSATI